MTGGPEMWGSILSSLGILGRRVFIFVFRTKISELLGRITGIGKGGITTSAATTLKEAQANPAPDPRAGADELMRALDNPLIREIETRIETELDKRGLKPGVPETAKVLTRYAAAALMMQADFENIDGTIFGSQIEILEELNGVEGADSVRLRPFYERAATIYPEVYTNYGFDPYMTYLANRTLVTRRPNGDLTISVKGRTYLMWRVHHGKPRRLG